MVYNERRKDWNLAKPQDFTMFLTQKKKRETGLSKSYAGKSMVGLQKTMPD